MEDLQQVAAHPAVLQVAPRQGGAIARKKEASVVEEVAVKVVAASWVRWRVGEREERRPSRWQHTRV